MIQSPFNHATTTTTTILLQSTQQFNTMIEEKNKSIVPERVRKKLRTRCTRSFASRSLSNIRTAIRQRGAETIDNS